MRTTDAFVGLDCTDCSARHDPATTVGRCPDCGGILDPAYDLDRVDIGPETVSARPFESLWRYEELLPFPGSAAVSMGEGATPLVDCPPLAERMGVERVLIKDEGRNPTGTFKDRGQTGAVTAAVEAGAAAIALNSAGNAGHAAAAYASRAGVDAHVFLPDRAGFTQRAMVEVHGGDLRVVPGEITDAGAAYQEAIEDHPEWHSTKTFVTPYRHDVKKTMLFEIGEQLGWTAPDAVVYPTGGGVGLVGMHKGAEELQELGWLNEAPGLYAAQSTGCAPVVRAWEEGESVHEAWAEIDTPFGGIAVPDPGASPLVLEAMAESGGGAVACDDEAILDAAVAVAREAGVEMGATCAAAAAGAFDLADAGKFGPDDTVVLLNTGTGIKDVDLLRSHVGDDVLEA